VKGIKGTQPQNVDPAGWADMAGAATRTPPQGPALSEIYDTEFESLAHASYAADYTNFGFKPLEY
jgi:hypothetical protein